MTDTNMTTYYMNLWSNPNRKFVRVHIGCQNAYVDRKRRVTGNWHVERAERFEDLRGRYPDYSDFRKCSRKACFGSSCI